MHRISRAIFLASVVILACVLVFSLKRSGAPPAAARTPTVTVWGWNVAAKSLRTVLPAFQEKHPDIRVDVVMSGANVQSRFLLALASGTGAPDVMQLQSYESSRYVATGRLADLTSLASKYKNDFPPAAWANCTHEGRIYAIPWDIGPCAVFYKPQLFARYEIDPARIRTWDDFIEVGKEILQKSSGRTKMLALTPHWLQLPYEMMLQQIGGQVFDDAGRVVIDSAESRRVLETLRRMLDAGICSPVVPYSQEWMAGFNADTIATYPGAVWMGGTIKDTTGQYDAKSGQWRVLPLPAFEPGGLRTSNMGGSVLVIPQQCPNKAAAWAFIEHALCTRESQRAHYVNFDLFPALLPVLDDPVFDEPDPFYGGQHVRALFAAGVRDIPSLNRTADWVEAGTYINQALYVWAKDHRDTDQVLSELADKLARRLGREVAMSLRRHRHFYYFVAPFFVLFAVFSLYPLVASLLLSFVKWDGLTPMKWVGSGNFAAMLDDEILVHSLWNTLIIGLLSVPLMLVLAFLLAMALNASWLRARTILRASIFLPCVTPMVVIAIVFSLLLSTERGLLNYALGILGIEPVPWLHSDQWSKVSVAMLVVWRWTGYNMVLMLAGLQGIATENYEAAAVDGAGRLRQVWHVTLPLMRPTFLFCLTLSLVGTVYMFDEVFVLTGGGPGISSTNFGVYLFDLSFRDFRFGYASSVAYTVSVAVFLISLALTRFRRGEHA